MWYTRSGEGKDEDLPNEVEFIGTRQIVVA